MYCLFNFSQQYGCVSVDGGWQKMGHGKSYNSLSGKQNNRPDGFHIRHHPPINDLGAKEYLITPPHHRQNLDVIP